MAGRPADRRPAALPGRELHAASGSGPLRRSRRPCRRYVAAAAGQQPAHRWRWPAQMRADPALAQRRHAGAGAGRAAAPAHRRLQLHAGARHLRRATPPTNSGSTARQGFCEHIASAFVVLMRAPDMPARIVTGYQGGELNARRRLLGRAPERRPCLGRGLAGRRGLGAGRPDRRGLARPRRRVPAPGAAAGRVRRRVRRDEPRRWRSTCAPPGRRVNNGWNQWVLNYTQSRQLDLLKNLGFEAPSLAGPGDCCCSALLVARQPGGRRLDAVGAQPARPLAAPAGAGAQRGSRQAGIELPDARRRARWRRRCASASATPRSAGRLAAAPRGAALRARRRRQGLAALRASSRRWPGRAEPLVRCARAGPAAQSRRCAALRCPSPASWPPRSLAPRPRRAAPRPRSARCAAACPTPRATTRMQFADEVAAAPQPRCATGCAPPSAARAACPACRG